MSSEARGATRSVIAGILLCAGTLLGTLLVAACGGGAETADEAARSPRAESRDTAPASEAPARMDGSGGMAGMTVRIPPEQASRIGLRWAAAETRPLVRTVRTAAIVEYPESEMVWISPKVGGWVERLHVTFEGAVVRKGRPLLDLYSPELVTAQEELLLARRLEEDLRAGRRLDDDPRAGRVSTPRDSLLEVARRRLRFWDISDDQVERLLQTGEVTKTLTLHAPTTGVVMKKEVFEGQGVKPGENLLMIAPIHTVWVEAAVYEQDLPFVREGLPVRVSVQGLPGRTFTGRVTYLYPDLRGSSRTVRARVEIPNPRGDLRPGMYATVGIESRSEPVLTVPASAVLHTGTREVVFMDMGGGRLMPMVVELGRTGDERVEVLAGLEPGTRVATSAQFLIDSEANLMEAMQAMMAEMGRMEMGEMEMGDMEMENAEPPPGRGRDTTDGGGR